MKSILMLTIFCCVSSFSLLANTIIGPFAYGVGHANGFAAATSAELEILIGPPALEATCASTAGFPSHDPACLALFDGILTTASVGQVITIDAANNVLFGSIVTLLNSGFSFSNKGSDSNGFAAANGSIGTPVSGQISSAQVTITSVCFSATPTCNGNLNSFVNGTVTVQTIPEPSSALLIFTGIVGLTWVFRRRWVRNG